MLKQTLLAASLALLLVGPATAGDPGKRDQNPVAAMVNRANPKTPPAKQDDDRKPDADLDRKRGQGQDRSGDHDRGQDHDRDQDRVVVRDWRDNNPREIDSSRDDWRDRDRDDRNWRRNDGRDHDRDDHDWRRDDWRDRDWRRDDDWRRRGWVYNGWRNDGWRSYRFNDNRHWRYLPPYRYSLDFGYRSGYELAWRDWLSYGRYDRYWRRGSFYGFGVGNGYRDGYDAGWRDAAFYYGQGYRPDYWGYDPQGGWYFSFRIEG